MHEQKVHSLLRELTPEQRKWINVLCHETQLPKLEALQLNDRLHRLAAEHFQLTFICLQQPLSRNQEQARRVIESLIANLLNDKQGILGVRFIYDPRGTTVGVKFTSNVSDSLTGTYKIPLNPEYVATLANKPFWEAYFVKEDYFILTIDNTDNAAFASSRRDWEIARIIDQAGKRTRHNDWPEDQPTTLYDSNGNKVGEVVFRTTLPAERDLPDGAVRLVINLVNEAFQYETTNEIHRILDKVVEKVREGEREFVLHDINDNVVGKYRYQAPPSLEKDGVVDMNEALMSGRVYVADGGFSGMADGEYRYVVTTPDFEPGYGQYEGEVWLVNAKGEVAAGYETPQMVREDAFLELSQDEKNAILSVVKEEMSLEEFERRLSDDGLGLDA
jgi:hypothetical protein